MSDFADRLRKGWQYIFRGEKTVANLTETWRGNHPTFTEASFVKMVKEGYRKNELIYACTSKTANSAAQVSAQLRRKRGKAVVEEHAVLDLIRRPNPFMGEFDLYTAILTLQRLAGRAPFEKERNRRGQVVRLWPLRPDWLSVVPSKTNMIAEYEYNVPGMTEPQKLRVEDVLDFKVYDPLNKWNSFPPAQVAGRVGDVDNSVTDFLKLFFEKGGVPPGLLKTKQKLVDSQVTDIRRRWRERYGGVDKWIEPAILDSDAEYQKTGLSFEEMGFEVLDARNEARICMVLDVPPILVGAAVGLARSTYSNYREARKAWWEDSLSPVYENLQDVIQTGLVDEFDESLVAGWDFSRVAAFQEENNEKWRRATDALRSGGITVNQFQAEVGLPDTGRAGEVYLRPLNVVEVPAKVGKRPSEAVGSSEDGETDDEEMADDGDTVKSVTGEELNAKAQRRKEKADVAPDSEVREKHERVIRKAVEGFLEEQMKRAVEDAK